MAREKENKPGERKKMCRWAAGIALLLLLFYGYALAAYINLLVNHRDGWLALVETDEVFVKEVYGERGNIYDTKGRLVQATLPYYYLVMDTRVPYLHQNNDSVYRALSDSACAALSRTFGEESPQELKARMDRAFRAGVGEFRLVRRRVSYTELQEVRQMPLFRLPRVRSGLIVRQRNNRENLFGDEAERVVGAVYGVNDTARGFGRYGLEQYFDAELSGTPGRVTRRRVGVGWLDVPIEQPEDGMDVVMTIDMDIQDICEAVMLEKMEQSRSEAGTMVLMDTHTGEIRAMVNLKRDTANNRIIQGENFAVAMDNQPGSSFKTVCMMAAIERGLCDTGTVVRTDGGRGTFGGVKVEDSHLYDEQELTATEIIARSSNVGIARIFDEGYPHHKNGYRRFADDILATGFARPIGIELKGEVMPTIYHPDTYDKWGPTTMTAMSRGYEVQTTPLYTLNFYNAIANDGYYVKPHLVRQLRRGGAVEQEFEPQRAKERMCSRATLDRIRYMLHEAVYRPTGTGYGFVNSRLFGISGKTGTARLNQLPTGDWQYQITFVGYFPDDRPRYTGIVVFVRPDQAWTGYYAGEAFRRVAETIWAMEGTKRK